MGGNIVDLSNLYNDDLINELKNRGYYTEFLMGTADVELRLDSVNEDFDDEKVIELSEEEKRNVIMNCFEKEYFTEQLNESIDDYIRNNYDND